MIQGRVTAVEPNDLTKDGGSSRGGTVLLDNGSTVEYDWLVLALGAETNTRNVPGVKDFAIPFNSFEDAEKVKNGYERKGRGRLYVVCDKDLQNWFETSCL